MHITWGGALVLDALHAPAACIPVSSGHGVVHISLV